MVLYENGTKRAKPNTLQLVVLWKPLLSCRVSLCVAVVVLSCTASVLGEPLGDEADGKWSLPATWGKGGVPAKGDSATVDGHVVTLDVSLSGDRKPDRLVLSRGGTIVVHRGSDREVACPLTLDGGTWHSPDHWAARQGSTILSGTLNLTRATTFSGVRGTQVQMLGKLSGKGKLLVTSTDAYFSSAFTLSLEHENAHTGGTEILEGRYATVKVAANRALGRGPVTVGTGALLITADQDYEKETPPTVTVKSKGTVRLETERVNLPFVVDGGQIVTAAGGAAHREITGNITLDKGGMMLFTSRNRVMRLSGKIDGSGQLRTTKNDYYYLSSGCTWSALAGTGNTYSGGTQINPGGGLQVLSDGALGSGPVDVRSAGIFPYGGGCLRGGLSIDVQQDYPKRGQPEIRIADAGALYINVPTKTHLNLDVMLDGGEISGAWREKKDNGLAGTVTLAADSFLGGSKGSLEISGKITGPFQLTRRENAASGDGPHATLEGPVILSHPDNDFTGGLNVSFGVLKSRGAGALGLGPVRVDNPGLLHLERTVPADWPCSSTFTGTGTIRVEDGSGQFNLISHGGIVQPGTDGGTLSIEGGFRFGSNPRRGVLNTRILSGEKGAVACKLRVEHEIYDLDQGVLDINFDDRLTQEQLVGKSFVILQCANDLTSQRFHAVTWDSGWTGNVEYGDGYVRLSRIVHLPDTLTKTNDPHRFGEILGSFAPQFSTAEVGRAGIQLLDEYAGRSRVLRTHAVSRGRPCVLRAPVAIPRKGVTRLLLGVSHRKPECDWQLIVKVGDEKLYDGLIGPQTVKAGWADLSVDLSRFAGKKIVLEIHNHPNDWSGEDAYFSKIEIVSE